MPTISKCNRTLIAIQNSETNGFYVFRAVVPIAEPFAPFLLAAAVPFAAHTKSFRGVTNIIRNHKLKSFQCTFCPEIGGIAEPSLAASILLPITLIFCMGCMHASCFAVIAGPCSTERQRLSHETSQWIVWTGSSCSSRAHTYRSSDLEPHIPRPILHD